MSGAAKRAERNSLTALQRIQNLENLVMILNEDRKKLLEQINGSFSLAEQRLDTLEKCANATAETIDKAVAAINQQQFVQQGEGTADAPGVPTTVKLDDVTSTLQRQLRNEQSMKAAREKAAIDGAVAAGALVMADVVQSESVIVGQELEKDGSIRHPGWIQLLFSEVRPELQASLLGKKVGESIDMPNGTFVVTAIYKVAPQQQDAPAPAAEASTQNQALQPAAEPTPAPEVVAEADAEEALEAYMAEGNKGESGSGSTN